MTSVSMKAVSTIPAEDEYLVIGRDFLLKDDQYLNFDIYSSRTSLSSEKPILLARKNSAISNLKKL